MKIKNINNLVSVIIPVYNCEKHLSESIESVINQDYSPLELIIVDGESNDKTVEIARSYNQTKILVQKKRGITEAFNLGIKEAKGEFIAFQSGDDIWSENKINVQVGFLKNNPQAEYCITKFRYFLDNDSSFPKGFKTKLIDSELSGPTLETFIARKSLFNKVGIFDTDFSSALDVEWFARLNDKNIKMHIIPEVLLMKRLHDNNISLNEKSNQNQIFKALRKSINRKNN